jgi:3-phenylpropionate/cinnamic acid dioxygenase small subunit
MSGEDPRLAQQIVIERADAATGAEAIAPDHVARGAVAARPVAAAVTTEVVRELEQLLYHQAELLDGKRWADYIELFADTGVYWMPVTPDQTEWEGSPSIFAEDKAMMEVRMGRVSHPTAWSQVPMWGTSHVVGNVVVEAAAADRWVVRSRFHMMELRRDAVRHFAGSYRHTIVRERGALRIELQRVDLVNAQAPFDYVLQVWV